MTYPDDNNPRRPHPLERGNDEPSYQQPQAEQPQEQITINMQRRTAVITFALIAVNVAIFLFGIATDSTQRLWFFGAINGGWVFNDNEYYRLFTAMFLHGSISHLFFNMYALYILGMSIEQMYGRWRFSAIYILGGLTGSVASAALNLTGPRDFGLGASGAVFALLGAQILYFWRYRETLGAYARGALRQYAILLGINLFFGLAVPQIDNTAHMGGLVGGAVLGFLLAPQLAARFGYDYVGNPVRVVNVTDSDGGATVATIYGLSLVGLVAIAGFVLY